MTNATLSEKEVLLIEDLITQHGEIFTFDQIQAHWKDQLSYQDIKNRVSRLVEKGWLIRIKRGLYTLGDIGSRGTTSLSFYKIAQLINERSYVSFEAALQYHGMFDQMLKDIVSISLDRVRTKEVQGLTYKYIFVKEDSFYGFEEERVGGSQFANIAYAEKALLDMLTFNKSLYTIDIILEKLVNHGHDLNLDRFYEFLIKQKTSVQRIMGFLFDKAGIDSSKIEDLLKLEKGYSRMSEDSKKFDSKWKLYYSDSKINEY